MEKGFTLLEIIVIVAVLSILTGVSISGFQDWQKRTVLSGEADELISALRFAQSKAMASENSSQYGIYFDASSSPNKYVLFKGNNYSSRDVSSDQVHWLNQAIEFSGINLSGGAETVFDKFTGSTAQPGNLSLRLKSDATQIRTLYISNSGSTSLTEPAAPSDDSRIKDYRHIIVAYSRNILTSENIVLTFEGGVVQTIPISQNMSGNEISWSGTVNVNGANQTIEIRTNRLNSPDTEFSIHRDRRLNNKSVVITISGDVSGSIANFSADGLTASSSSIFITNFTRQ